MESMRKVKRNFRKNGKDCVTFFRRKKVANKEVGE